MYWCVIGAIVAFEYVAEWLICWQALNCLPSHPRRLSIFVQVAVLLGSQDHLSPLSLITTDSGLSGIFLIT